MNKLTDKQKKALLICAGLFVASYIVKWLVTSAQQAAFLQQQAIIAAQQRANAAKNAPKQSEAPQNAKGKGKQEKRPPLWVVTDLGNLSGTWQGSRLLARKGMCTLRLEMRPVPEKTEDYKGYARFNCVPPAGLTSFYNGGALPKQQRDNLNPVAMVLTGVPDEGSSLHFVLDKTVVTPNDDCETTQFNVTPFGTNQVAVEWREGVCRGVQLILNKSGR